MQRLSDMGSASDAILIIYGLEAYEERQRVEASDARYRFALMFEEVSDRHTLEVQGQERMYAIGDATNLPVSKSGSAAHFQAQAVAERITAEMTGKPSDGDDYNGHVLCFIETGKEQATTITFDYDHPPVPPHPSHIYHYEKMVFNKAYRHIVPTGIV